MAFHTLQTLLSGQNDLMRMAGKLTSLGRGMVVVTGQSGSGKLTTLVALADFIAAETRAVLVLTDHEQSIEPCRPFPANWTVVIEPDRQ